MNCRECKYFNGKLCTDETIWHNESNESVCRYQPGARMVEQKEDFANVSSRFSLEEKAELETVVGFAKDLLEDNIEMSIIKRKSIEYIATVVKRIMAT